MKKIIFTVVVFTLFFSSCTKKKDTPSNRWTLGGTTYNTAYAGYGAAHFTATDGADSASNFCSFTFSDPEIKAGTYRVVGSFSSISVSNEVVVSTIDRKRNLTYESTDYSHATLTVTNNNGKLTLSLPDTYVQEFDSKDSLVFSAQLIQTY